MFPLSFKKSFDIEFIQSLYDRLVSHDDSLKLILRTKNGRKTDDPSKAGIGEIRNASNKQLFGMSAKEGIVHTKHAGVLQTPLFDFLKERGIHQQEVSPDTGVACVLLYVVLVAGGGLLYTTHNNVGFLYPYLLGCVASVLLGLALISYAYKPGQKKWSIPAMVLLAIGALPTAPSSLLALPMINYLGRAKLHRVFNQGGEDAETIHT
ncbi:hypothetical protein QEN58_16145 [Halomonas alkaliantarctica]|uniref:Uncharacterized protein n=1 Tax=Halomonas alkaliantarctica TaxID=232346 RepID=A0ABY8LK77_9GAMM|nr:hypothetical protein [Halomonas alkaliantarctica]WGI24840.1 hypothetical protein QEN58_16145 [Halomonas alkaliantarctica]